MGSYGGSLTGWATTGTRTISESVDFLSKAWGERKFSAERKFLTEETLPMRTLSLVELLYEWITLNYILLEFMC